MGNSICLKNDIVGLEEQSEDNFPVDFKFQWKKIFENYCDQHKDEFVWTQQAGMYLLQLDKFPLKKHYQEVRQLVSQYMSVNPPCSEDQYKSITILEDKLIHRPSAVEYSMNRGKDQENYLSQYSTTQQPPGSAIISSTNMTRNHHKASLTEQDKQNIGTITNSFIYQDIILSKKEHQDWTDKMKTEANTQGDFMFKLIKIIKLHLKCEQNQIHNICELFFSNIKSIYENYVEGCYAKLKEEIQSFSEILLEMILYYYSLNHLFSSGDNFSSQISNVNQSCSNYYLNKKNLLSFFQGWILEDKRVYTIVMCILIIDNKKIMQTLGQNMIHMREKQLKQGRLLLEEINVQYRLDGSTYEFFQLNFPSVERQGYKPNRKPYENAYKYFQKICDKKNIQSKLKIIVKTQEKLIQSIKNFYNQYGVPFSCNIGGDDLFPIQIYILVMSRIIDINVHLQFCHDFALQKHINSIVGYYIMSYMAVANFIMTQDVQKSKSDEKIQFEKLPSFCEGNN